MNTSPYGKVRGQKDAKNLPKMEYANIVLDEKYKNEGT